MVVYVALTVPFTCICHVSHTVNINKYSIIYYIFYNKYTISSVIVIMYTLVQILCALSAMSHGVGYSKEKTTLNSLIDHKTKC